MGQYYTIKNTPLVFNRRAYSLARLANLKAIFYISKELALFSVLSIRINPVAVEIVRAKGQPKIILKFIANLGRNPALVIIGTRAQCEGGAKRDAEQRESWKVTRSHESRSWNRAEFASLIAAV